MTGAAYAPALLRENAAATEQDTLRLGRRTDSAPRPFARKRGGYGGGIRCAWEEERIAHSAHLRENVAATEQVTLRLDDFSVPEAFIRLKKDLLTARNG
jgi:hypothetical protein